MSIAHANRDDEVIDLVEVLREVVAAVDKFEEAENLAVVPGEIGMKVDKLLKNYPTFMRKQKFWTFGYNAFVMGGTTQYRLVVELDVSAVVDIGKGFKAMVGMLPNGTQLYADPASGAICGDNLATVMEDVTAGDEKDMRKQLKEMLVASKNVREELVSPEDFVKRTKNAKS